MGDTKSFADEIIVGKLKTVSYAALCRGGGASREQLIFPAQRLMITILQCSSHLTVSVGSCDSSSPVGLVTLPLRSP
jgi:hypothetical protein